MDPLDTISAHEQGELSASDTLDLFSHLITAGDVGTLQGHHGRTARDVIQFGWITPSGELTAEGAVYAAGPPDWPS